MSKLFNNPFKRREREQERLKQEAQARLERSFAHTSVPPGSRQGTIPRRQLAPSECLGAVQSLLEQVRAMNPQDIHAFPLLNQSQRLVQELRESVHIFIPPADQSAWTFQIQELQEEVRSQTDRIVSSTATKPEPRSNRRTSTQTVGHQYNGRASVSPGQNHEQAMANAIAAQRSLSSRSAASSAPSYPSSQGRATMQPPVQGTQQSPSSVALQGALFPAQQQGSAAGRMGVQSPMRGQQHLHSSLEPSRVAAAPGDEEDMFSGLSVAEPSPVSIRSTSGPAAAPPSPGLQSTWEASTYSHTAIANHSADSTSSPSPAHPLHAPQPLLASSASHSSAFSPYVHSAVAATATAATDASSPHRNRSWPTDMAAAAQDRTHSPSANGTDTSELGGKKAMKKKTRGLKVGYGNLEDPAAPSTEPSPSSFTAAGQSNHTLSRNSSSSMNVTVSQVLAVSMQQQKEQQQTQQQQMQQQQAQQQLLQQQLAQQQQMQQQMGESQLRAATAAARDKQVAYAAAARRLNLPNMQGPVQGSFRVTTPPLTQNSSNVVNHGLRPPSAPPHAHPSVGRGELAPGPAAAMSWLDVKALPNGQQQLEGATAWHTRQMAPPLQGSAITPATMGSVTQALETPVSRFETYLSTLAGPLEQCQQTAETAAAEAVQQLEAAANSLKQQESTAHQARLARLAELAACSKTTADLERQQQMAVTREDYDAAAALDYRLQQAAAQAATLEESARKLEETASQLAGRRLDLLAQQGHVWGAAAAYISRLHDGHMAAAAAAEAVLERELSTLESQQAQVETAISEASAALSARRAELVAARREVEGRALATSWPLHGERERLSRMHAEMESQVQRLQELLEQREQQLADASTHLALVHSQISALSEPFAPELAAVREGEIQLQAQDAALQQQVQVMVQCRNQTGQRRDAALQQRKLMDNQARELLEAQGKLMVFAAEAHRRAGVEEGDKAQRQALAAQEEAARDSLARLSKSLEDLSLEVEALTARSSQLEAEAADLETQAAQAAQMVPDLEAAKKAAAARKEFKEAARLSAESKMAQLRAEGLTQKAVQVQGDLQQVSVLRTSKASELEKMRSGMQGLQRNAALARHRSLSYSIEQKQLQMNTAAAEERYEEAQHLQLDLNSTAAEAAGLEQIWGFKKDEGASASPAQTTPHAVGMTGSKPEPQGSGILSAEQLDASASSSRNGTRDTHAAAENSSVEHQQGEPGQEGLPSGRASTAASSGLSGGGGHESMPWRSNDLFDSQGSGMDLSTSKPAFSLGAASAQNDFTTTTLMIGMAAARHEDQLPSRATAEQLLL